MTRKSTPASVRAGYCGGVPSNRRLCNTHKWVAPSNTYRGSLGRLPSLIVKVPRLQDAWKRSHASPRPSPGPHHATGNRTYRPVGWSWDPLRRRFAVTYARTSVPASGCARPVRVMAERIKRYIALCSYSFDEDNAMIKTVVVCCDNTNNGANGGYRWLLVITPTTAQQR